MNRLTGKNDLGQITSYNPITDYVAGDKEIQKRLAEYEDTGLSPKSVFQLKAAGEEVVKQIKFIVLSNEPYPIKDKCLDEKINNLSDLFDDIAAAKQGNYCA